jgi:hypothetical protein
VNEGCVCSCKWVTNAGVRGGGGGEGKRLS